MIKIRGSLFETNSSSMHSLVLFSNREDEKIEVVSHIDLRISKVRDELETFEEKASFIYQFIPCEDENRFLKWFEKKYGEAEDWEYRFTEEYIKEAYSKDSDFVEFYNSYKIPLLRALKLANNGHKVTFENTRYFKPIISDMCDEFLGETAEEILEILTNPSLIIGIDYCSMSGHILNKRKFYEYLNGELKEEFY